jgi:hypothetical protein
VGTPEAVQQVIAAIQTHGPEVVRLIKESPVIILAGIIAHGPAVLAWLKDTGGKLGEALKAQGIEILTWMKGAPAQMVEAIKQHGPALFTWIRSAPEQAVAAVKQYGIDIFQWIKGAPEQFMTGLRGAGIEIFEKMKQVGNELVAWFQQGNLPGRIFELLVKFGDELVEAVKERGTAFFDLLKMAGEGLLENWEKVKEIIALAKSLISAPDDFLQTLITDPVGLLRNIAGAIMQGTREFFSDPRGEIVWEWLLDGLNIKMPESFTADSMGNMFMEATGLGYESGARDKFVEALGEERVGELEEQAGSALNIWKENGPWAFLKHQAASEFQQLLETIEKAQEKLWDLAKDSVMEALTDLIPGTSVLKDIGEAAVAATEFIKAILGEIKGFLEVIKLALEQAKAVAQGQVDAIVEKVKEILAETAKATLSTLAAMSGLTDVPGRVRGIIEGVRPDMELALDTVTGYLAESLKEGP